MPSYNNYITSNFEDLKSFKTKRCKSKRRHKKSRNHLHKTQKPQITMKGFVSMSIPPPPKKKKKGVGKKRKKKKFKTLKKLEARVFI